MLGVVASAPENDSVAQIYKGRIANQLATGWIPGARAAARLGRAAEAVANGDIQGAGRAVIGMPGGEESGQPNYGVR
jgi:uncharacterized membrane protein